MYHCLLSRLFVFGFGAAWPGRDGVMSALARSKQIEKKKRESAAKFHLTQQKQNNPHATTTPSLCPP